MTPDTEALRAQFERRMNLRGWSEANIRRDGLDYSSTQITEAWHAFQAGHAAAKAETAAPVVGRWYFVTNDGAATLCVDEADARESAAEADIAFPRMAPHRAVQLVPADQLAAAGEPVAFAHFAENGNIRLWAPERPRDLDGNIAQALYTADQLAAAVAAERERAATVCERIADDYNRREGLKYPELKTDAETGANECADAIRAGAKEPSDA